MERERERMNEDKGQMYNKCKSTLQIKDDCDTPSKFIQ